MTNFKEFRQHNTEAIQSLVESYDSKSMMPSVTALASQHIILESAAPGMEDWVIANKQKFIDQYGKEKGLQVLYATSWKLHNEKGAK